MAEIVTVLVSCSTATVSSERRFGKDLLVSDLKAKLELITGANAGFMVPCRVPGSAPGPFSQTPASAEPATV